MTLRTWHPEGPNVQPEQRTDIMPHHEVLLRLDAMDLERGKHLHITNTIYTAHPLSPLSGAKIAGHRGYYLTNDGIDLNQALISYGLDFLRKRGYKFCQFRCLVTFLTCFVLPLTLSIASLLASSPNQYPRNDDGA